MHDASLQCRTYLQIEHFRNVCVLPESLHNKLPTITSFRYSIFEYNHSILAQTRHYDNENFCEITRWWKPETFAINSLPARAEISENRIWRHKIQILIPICAHFEEFSNRATKRTTQLLISFELRKSKIVTYFVNFTISDRRFKPNLKFV